MPVPVAVDAESVNKGVDAIERVLNLLNTPLQKIKSYVTNEAVAHFKVGFREFLLVSYNRCRFYKSILSKTPVNILDSYTNIYLDGEIEGDDSSILDEDLIAKIFERNYLVITGSAGGGKSMFMRFLTMKIFYEHGDKIPIFLELRKLNEQSDADLIEFVYNQCSPKGHFVTLEQFSKAIKAGGIVFILDGFDELNFEIRDKIQKQILDIQKNYPHAAVVVSSRPDDRFAGWNHYYEYSVNNLNKIQCLDLISKLVIDNGGGVKGRFYKAVEAKLYETHETFLSSPLLITIMLFTYEGDGDVPSKMHEFYGSAYDVLFQRHDATKEQYVRKKYTQLSKDDFAICFSAFCALSYRAEKFEFDEDLLNSYSNRAIRYANSCGIQSNLLTVKNFKLDMVESICLLQMDGKYWSFVHRSFQEYFSAKFLSKLDDGNAKKLLCEFNLRRMDNVFFYCLKLTKIKCKEYGLFQILKL